MFASQLTSWPWCGGTTNAASASTRLAQSSLGKLPFVLLMSQPKGLPSLWVCRDHNCGFVGFRNTQEHGGFIL